jgi:hypothetical protein
LTTAIAARKTSPIEHFDKTGEPISLADPPILLPDLMDFCRSFLLVLLVLAFLLSIFGRT